MKRKLGFAVLVLIAFTTVVITALWSRLWTTGLRPAELSSNLRAPRPPLQPIDSTLTCTHTFKSELMQEVGSDWSITHVLLRDDLGDRFRINEVVFVGFAIRLHELRRDQSHLVPLLAQPGAQTMRSGTCFQTVRLHAKYRRTLRAATGPTDVSVSTTEIPPFDFGKSERAVFWEYTADPVSVHSTRASMRKTIWNYPPISTGMTSRK